MSKVREFIKLARIYQYTKNVPVFLPAVFSYKLGDWTAITTAACAFLAFCGMASSVYVLNDILDIDEDRHHPAKRHRPLASGKITVREASCFGIALGFLSIIFSVLLLPYSSLIWLLIYMVLNILYSAKLKEIPIIDVLCVSAGFVLRILVGAYAISVLPNHWIILMTFLLALFLSFAKRRDDIVISGNNNNGLIRCVIAGYSLEFVSTLMSVLASVVIICYILFTLSPETVAKHGTHNLYSSSFWVIMGIIRYMQLTFVYQRSGSPSRILIEDMPLKIITVLWVIHIIFILYVK